MVGLTVKVHLGSLGSAYGITTGKSKTIKYKGTDTTLFEVVQCPPMSLSKIDMIRCPIKVDFNIRFGNMIKVYKDAVEVHPREEQLRYYKLKKTSF